MIIFLKRGSKTERFLHEEFINVGRESAYVQVFKLILEPPRYYNCQGTGHKAFSYREAQRYDYYTQEDHSINNYSSELKYVNYLGSHSIISKACPMLHRL